MKLWIWTWVVAILQIQGQDPRSERLNRVGKKRVQTNSAKPAEKREKIREEGGPGGKLAAKPVKNLKTEIVSYYRRNSTRGINGKRCRSMDQLGELPWTLNTSTFYNFGIPLIASLCPTMDPIISKMIECRTIEDIVWQRSSFSEVRSGPDASTMLIDPPCDDDGGASSGVFVINAMYPILLQLGYKTRIRNWSQGLNGLFSPEVVASALNDSIQWNRFLNKTQSSNPFADVQDYISFQVEVGLNYWKNGQPDIVETSHSRELRWIIGHQRRATDPLYAAPKGHCIGANFFLSEGMHCAGSGVIMCPMFPIHTTESRRYMARLQSDPGFFWQSKVSKNIVLIDNDAGAHISYARLGFDLQRLGLKNVEVKVHKNRLRSDIPQLYRKVKVSLDCSNPGVEFINYESSLYKVLNVACNSRATRNVFDFPVPSRYRIEPTNWNETVRFVHDLLVNYTDHIDAFKHFRELSRRSSTLIPNQLDLHLFSRDVLFRTYCHTFADCRHVMPWALSIWVLFPMARIEVYTAILLNEFEMENDLILDLLSHAFSSRFFKVIRWLGVENGRGLPVFVEPKFPCAYVVYTAPHFVLFGRDFLNEHLAQLSRHKAPILHHRNGELVVAVMAKGMIPEVTFWMSNTTEGELIIMEGGKQHVTDMAGFKALGYNVFSSVRATTKENIHSHPVGPPRPFSNDPQSYWSQYHDPYFGPVLPLDMFYLRQSEEGKGHRVASGSPASTTSAELWVASSVVPIPQASIASAFKAADMGAIAAHLDPILESTYFKKAMRFFPTVVQDVLGTYSAAHFPHVISLRDAYYPHWGELCETT